MPRNQHSNFYSRREGKNGISVSEINFVLAGKSIKEMLLRVSGSIVKDEKLSERVSNVTAAMTELAQCLRLFQACSKKNEARQ